MKTSIVNVKLSANEFSPASYCLKCFMIVSVIFCAFAIVPKVMAEHGKSTALNLLQDINIV